MARVDLKPREEMPLNNVAIWGMKTNGDLTLNYGERLRETEKQLDFEFWREA